MIETINKAIIASVKYEMKHFILGKCSPIQYYDIYKNITVMDSDRHSVLENIYKKNFIIRHVLYLLQFEFYSFYSFLLHIDIDKIYFNKIPQDGCWFFSTYQNKFLYMDNKKVCTDITFNGLRDFYYDFDNINKACEKKLENAVASFLLLGQDKQYLENACTLLNLSLSTLTINDLKKNYRKIVKQYHPDTSNNDSTDKSHIAKVTEAYFFLKNLFF